MPQLAYGSVPFVEQIRFFRDKLNVPTTRWTDVWKAQHDQAFMVAGAAKADLLADLRAAVDKAIADGTTLETFRKDFDQVVARHGWDYTGGRAWRTRVIFETNIRSSYQAGRFEQLQAVKARRPFWLYKHSEAVTHPRPLHQSWDGLVLDADDPWWQTHYPPNGWGCKCTVRSLNEREMRRRGLTPGQAPDDGSRTWVDKATGEAHVVPNGIDPGWDYSPGRRAAELRTGLRDKAASLPEPLRRQALADFDNPPPAPPAPEA